MSKERARRRAEREAVLAVEREKRARVVRRRALRRRVFAPVTGAWRGLRRWLRAATVDASPLTRRRRAQNAALLVGLVLLNLLLWVVVPSWALRGVAIGVSAMGWPLLTVLLFNRRPAG
jgi:hypothetical protein